MVNRQTAEEEVLDRISRDVSCFVRQWTRASYLADSLIFPGEFIFSITLICGCLSRRHVGEVVCGGTSCRYPGLFVVRCLSVGE